MAIQSGVVCVIQRARLWVSFVSQGVSGHPLDDFGRQKIEPSIKNLGVAFRGRKGFEGGDRFHKRTRGFLDFFVVDSLACKKDKSSRFFGKRFALEEKGQRNLV